jgi:hypothetical protein
MPVMPVPDYDFICYFLAQAFSLLDFQPVMPVPQWCFRLNRLQPISSARIGGGKKKQSGSGGLSSPLSLCCVK